MAFSIETFNGFEAVSTDKTLPLPKPVNGRGMPDSYDMTDPKRYEFFKDSFDTLPKPGVKLPVGWAKALAPYEYNVPRPSFDALVSDWIIRDEMQRSDLEDKGLGWSLKRMSRAVKQVVKHPLKQPLKTLAVLTPVTAPAFGLKKETRGRIVRRIGGGVSGAVTGFLVGGPVGAAIGAGTGLSMAKKGTKGIKGYGKIAVVGAAAGGVGSAIVGAAAQGMYSAGLISQQTAQSAILASGRAGMMGFSAVASRGASLTSWLPTTGTTIKAAGAAQPVFSSITGGAQPSGPQPVESYYQSEPGAPLVNVENIQSPIAPDMPISGSDTGLTPSGERPGSAVPVGTTPEGWAAYEGATSAKYDEAGTATGFAPIPPPKINTKLLLAGAGILGLLFLMSRETSRR